MATSHRSKFRYAAAIRSLCSGIFWPRGVVRDDNGSIGVMFAGIIVVMVMFLGTSIDMGNAFLAREGIQDALDSAALAAGRELETGGEKLDAETKAREVFAANLPEGVAAKLTGVEIDTDVGQIDLQAAATLQTSFMRIAGINELAIDAKSMVNTSGGSFEVVMVLDSSGSMNGTHIEGLKTASHALVTSLFGDKAVSNNVKIGVVPFSGLVNVGPQNANATWIDSDGRSSVHFENMSEEVSRFDLLERMDNVSWAGCVEARPGELATSDTEADLAEPDSLFVPNFAPDEPDAANDDGDRYYNSYLADDGGTCVAQPSTCVRRDWRGTCVQSRTASIEPVIAQSRLCKYDNVAVTETATSATSTGPNHMCDSRPITPLTNDRQAVDEAIDQLVAKGYTNIGEGVMWGWRVLSPQEPFSEGLPKNSPNNLKVIVLMSDGANTLNAINNHNKSYYSAWGYAATERLAASAKTSQAYTAAMDAMMDQACQGARADNVIIYSVAYNLSSQPAARAALKRCASQPEKYFEAGSEAALLRAFETIGLDLNELRISS
jgi:Flp pilus assembly protein TadG